MKIAGRIIGQYQRPFVIAEAGSNHNQDFETALKLIDAAAEAGADAVKFQVFSAETLYSRFTPRFSEMEGRSRDGESPFELIRRVELPREWLPKLAEHSKRRSILFTASPFDVEAVQQLVQVGVPFLKVASYEIVDTVLLRTIANTGSPVVLSTGNSSLADVEDALDVFRRQSPPPGVCLLHCVSQYPARFPDLNLRCIKTMHEAFHVPVGFSDHTMDSVAAVAAIGLGACVFEKHFTLSRNQAGPDHPSSLEPDELRDYVIKIQNGFDALGDGVKRVRDSESENHLLARRSIHAKVDICKGEVFTADMLLVKRPALGLPAKYMDQLIGRTAKVDIPADAWITWDMV